MYGEVNYLKKVGFAIIGAVFAVPAVASGYYLIYLFVTAVGN